MCVGIWWLGERTKGKVLSPLMLVVIKEVKYQNGNEMPQQNRKISGISNPKAPF